MDLSVFLTSFVIAFFAAIAIYFMKKLWEGPPSDQSKADPMSAQSTRQIEDVNESAPVPEADQEYLIPIVTQVLKMLAKTKRALPTNAMLIEHLAESVGEASESFSPRKNNSEDPERHNEDWLVVAAFAIRLYDEGCAHNCREAREAFITEGVLAERRVQQWANKINSEIAKMVKDNVVPKQTGRDISDHVKTVGSTPYTADEIEDLKRGEDRRKSIIEKIRRAGGLI